MSKIDYQALRETADAANKASWGRWESYHPHEGERGHEVKVGVKAIAQLCLKVYAEFIAASNPATVLALLDELEAAEKRIAELEAREVVLPRSFNREIFGEGMYEVPNGNWMHRKDVTEALLAAGIITKVVE